MPEAEEEYTEDVTDLREAQHIIATLRRQIAELEPVEGEYWVFLNDKYDRMIQSLYAQNKLVYDQDDDLEVHEVFKQFVQDALEVWWDMAQFDDESERPHRIQRRITPSA